MFRWLKYFYENPAELIENKLPSFSFVIKFNLSMYIYFLFTNIDKIIDLDQSCRNLKGSWGKTCEKFSIWVKSRFLKWKSPLLPNHIFSMIFEFFFCLVLFFMILKKLSTFKFFSKNSNFFQKKPNFEKQTAWFIYL